MGKDCIDKERERELALGLQVERALRRVIGRGRRSFFHPNVSTSQSISSDGIVGTTYTVISPLIFEAFSTGSLNSVLFDQGSDLPSSNLIGSSFISNGGVFQMGLMNIMAVVNQTGSLVAEVGISSQVDANYALKELGIFQPIAVDQYNNITYLVNIQSFTFYTKQ